MFFEIIFIYVLITRGLKAAILLYLSLYLFLFVVVGIFFFCVSGVYSQINWQLPVATFGGIVMIGSIINAQHKHVIERRNAKSRLVFLEEASKLGKEDHKSLSYKPYIGL